MGHRRSARLNSSGGHGHLGTINCLRKASVEGTRLEATLSLVERPHNGRGAMPAPQKKKEPEPPINGCSGRHTPTPTSSLESGREPLSGGPNEGPLPKLGALPVP
jgi:hypothetical protein